MTEPGFSASIPDLLGHAKQVAALADGYNGIGFNIDSCYEMAKNLADTKSPLAGNGGILLPALGAFQDRSDSLAQVHNSASTVMSRCLYDNAGKVEDSAIAYEQQDNEAEAELKSADPAKDAEETAESITGGEANQDWSTDFDVKDFFTADIDGTIIPEMSFKPSLESTADVLIAVYEMPTFSSVDTIVEYFCGFSPMEEVCKPLLGDWGVLWYMADLYRCAAKAVDEVNLTLTSGINTLVVADWTGDAAHAYDKVGQQWDNVLAQHAKLLRDSAGVLDDTANKMQTEGAKIADATLVVADLALEIALTLSGRGGMKAAKKLIDDLIFAAPEIIAGIDAFKEFLDLAAIDVAKLVSDVASLNPPGNLQDNSK